MLFRSRQTIHNYIQKVYTTFHGQDPQGFQQLLQMARSQAFPPPDFKILSADELKAERDKQGAAGIQPITFSEADSKAFLAKSNDVAWQSVIKRAPETGAKLRALAGN